MSIINKDFFMTLNGHDPTQFNGENPKCTIYDCDKEIEMSDEYCEDHQPCIICAERLECECEDVFSNISACCEAKFLGETDICIDCKEHSGSSWDDAIEDLKKMKINH